LLLIVTHILVNGLLSKGSSIAFGACDFIVSLNMLICKSKCWHLEVLQLANVKVSHFLSHNNFFDDRKMERENVIYIMLHLELWIFNAKAIHQLKICKMLIQFNHAILIVVEH
jgi:hypothetical protein